MESYYFDLRLNEGVLMKIYEFLNLLVIGILIL